MEEERYRPGLLDLNLQISVVKNFPHLKYQLQLTKKLEEEYRDFATTVCAIQNLRGAVHFFLKDYESACKTFEQVLKRDESNLNALSNLEIIYRQLGCWSKADEYKNKLNCDDHKLKATCYGEQGFAMMFDCHISSNEYERFKRSEKHFQLCLQEIDKSGLENNATVQWHLWYIQLLSRLMNHCTKDNQEQERYNHWIDGLEQCLIVKQKLNDCDISDVKKKHLLSVATAYIAINGFKVNTILKDEILKQFSDLENSETTEQDAAKFLDSVCKMAQATDGPLEESQTSMTEKSIALEDKIAMLKDKLKSLPDKNKAVIEVVKSLKDPEKAFKSAMELHQNTEVLYRYALFVKGKTDATVKDLEFAEELIDKCIQSENGGNWFAFTIKSGIILSKCKQTYKKTSSLGQGKEKRDTAVQKIFRIKDSNLESKDSDENETHDPESQTAEAGNVWFITLENWLQDSIKYGKKAGEINATSKIYSDLGEAYHWLALNQKDPNMKEKCFFKSLANFLHALQHADGNKQSFVHTCHGECLFDMQQYLPALESFKRAIECGTRRAEYVYSKLFECYIKLQNEIGDTCNKDQLFANLAYWIRLGNDKFKTSEYWLDNILNNLTDQVQDDPIIVAEIERVFANVARELCERKTFPVSDRYLNDNTTFALCLFGETLQLQNKSYSESCIKMLDGEKMSQLNECKKMMCVQNVAKAFTAYKEICLKSPVKEYLRGEAFLISSFKQLHEKWKDFAELVAEEIKTSMPLLGCFLLSHVGNLPKETPIPESPITEMSMRELTFCVKQLDYKDKTHQQKFKDCIEAFDKYIEKLSTDQESEPEVGHGMLHVSEPKVRKKQYEYDFSVIYCESDSQWVVHSLLPTLERKYGFRGYVENRDLLPGQSKFNILEVFEKCYKVIVILTDKFCEDKWNYFVFQQAMYVRLGEHSVIPIQRSRLKETPKELTTVISLPAVQNLDWERLVKELE